jgi:hypothetical protein
VKRTRISRRPSKSKLEFELELDAVRDAVITRGCEFVDYAFPCLLPESIPDDWPKCGGYLLVHHAKGRAVKDANDPVNLRCLCDRHHRFVHGNSQWAREAGLMVSRLT